MDIWIPLNNPFETATKKSKRKMLLLIKGHSGLLHSVATLPETTMFTRTEPLKTSYSQKYAQWSAASAYWNGETRRIEAKLLELRSRKIDEWDIEIQRVFKHYDPDYGILLPNRRGPFQKGAYDEIITEVESLAIRLGNFSPNAILDAVKTDVEAFHTSISTIRELQRQKEQLVKLASDQLEVERTACAVMMFKNLGLFIETYPANVAVIENFYDLSLIQSTTDNSEEYSGLLEPSEQKNVVNTGITQQSRVIFKNTGDAAISVAIEATPDDMGAEPLSLPPGAEIDTADFPEGLPELPAYFLNMRNDSGAMVASYLVIVVN